MKKLDKDELDEDFVVSRIMVGDCPNCGSTNTHDCDQFQLGTIYIDDSTIGYCDDCNHMWCLHCGSELTTDNPNCGHWGICNECGKTWELPPGCPFKGEEEAGKLSTNPCLLGCPFIEECSRCPYSDPGEEENCPKILEWKQDKRSPK